MPEPPLPERRGSEAAHHAAAQPPAGYVHERERDAYIVALPSILSTVVTAVREQGTLYEWAARRAAATVFAGRASAYRVHVGADAWLVRHYRRGGLVGRIIEDHYLRIGEPRPVRELRASSAVRAAGVPTPEVIAAVVYAGVASYRGDLATRFVPDSADLAAVTWGETRWAERQRVAAWRAAGALLRQAFAAGVRHPDLNLRNLLIESRAEGVSAWLLDLDRAQVDVVSDVARRTMLDRFHRSRRKLETMAGEPVGALELAAFDAALRGAERD